MKGSELFSKYMSKRDYSDSPADEYAQTLHTIYMQIGSKIYPLLEKAEEEKKQLSIAYPADVLTQELETSMIELV